MRLKRAVMRQLMVIAVLALIAPWQARGGDLPPVTVFKTPSCGCCNAWARHLQENGFEVTIRDADNLSAIKLKNGVPASLQSCHTAVVDGYVLEGHVPADLVKRLLAERPEIAGLAVPDMPAGSPGMETGRHDPYEVLGFDRDGNIEVFDRR